MGSKTVLQKNKCPVCRGTASSHKLEVQNHRWHSRSPITRHAAVMLKCRHSLPRCFEGLRIKLRQWTPTFRGVSSSPMKNRRGESYDASETCQTFAPAQSRAPWSATSSKMGGGSSKMGVSSFFGSEERRPPIFHLLGPKNEEPPIFHLLDQKNEQPPGRPEGARSPRVRTPPSGPTLVSPTII